jgi:eukaryotic-like serine/threonine-protein kinase
LPVTLRSGTRLGPYEILGAIGAGGMGEVYRARDTRLDRSVAIKVLPAELAGDPERLARFAREAKAVAALSHPNIVAIHDFRDEGGTTFAVTELLLGHTLRERLGDGPLPVQKAIDCTVQIAHGLAAAHQRGIVHRDLKPENLFLCADGQVKILDFGLAKITPAPDSETLVQGEPVARGTDPGLILGTVGYMSPEQVRGLPADQRSDLFSLGAILYEMLAGRRAFNGATAADVMSAILREEPPELAAVRPGVPRELERLVRHCLEKSPELRLQAAQDLAFDLEGMPGRWPSEPKAALPPRSTGRPRRAALAALAAALLGATVAAVWLAAKSGDAPVPSYRRLTFRHGDVSGARFGADGKTIVYSAAWGGEPARVFSAGGEGAESRPFGVVGDAMLLALSRHDEVALLLRRGWLAPGMPIGTLARAPLSGEAPREIAEEVSAADWAPDGRELAVIRTVGGRHRLELPVGNVLFQTSGAEWIGDARVSPGGDLVAFVEHPRDLDVGGTITLVDAAGKVGKKALSGHFASAVGLAWHPEGREVWFTAAKTGRAQALYAVSLSGRERVVARSAGSLVLDDVSRDGRVLIRRQSRQAGIMGVFPPVAAAAAAEHDLSWLDGSLATDLSEDGTLLLFGEFAEGGGDHLPSYLRRTDGSPPVRLGDDLATSLSPDGKWVLTVPRGRPPRLVLLPTGPGQPRTIQNAGILEYRWAIFMPGGKQILFYGYGAEAGYALRTYVTDFAGGAARQIAPAGLIGNIPSPDGRWVASNGTERGILLLATGGGEPRPVPGTALQDRPFGWSPDQRFLYVYRRGEVPARTFRIELATGRKEPWRDLAPPDRAGVTSIVDPHLAADGIHYAYSYLRNLSDLYLAEGFR